MPEMTTLYGPVTFVGQMLPQAKGSKRLSNAVEDETFRAEKHRTGA